MKVDDVIIKLSKGFNQVFDDYKGAYVFGISSDRNVHDDEDIEIAALFDIEDKHKREQIWPLIGKIETDMGVFIDLYPYTEESFKNDEEIFNEVKSCGIFYDKFGKINLDKKP